MPAGLLEREAYVKKSSSLQMGADDNTTHPDLHGAGQLCTPLVVYARSGLRNLVLFSVILFL